MRASRLLHILLLLQNRGRLTSQTLAAELEVTPRTILRDMDALTEAGLPIITFQGNRGGFELGFNYRTRLTGLDEDEAEALGVWLSGMSPVLTALGMSDAAARAGRKLVESFPDAVRNKIGLARERFRIEPLAETAIDPRVAAFADAIRGRRLVRINARSKTSRTLAPIALIFGAEGWSILDESRPGELIPLDRCGDINIRAPSR